MDKGLEALKRMGEFHNKRYFAMKTDNGDNMAWNFNTVKELFPNEFEIIEKDLKDYDLLKRSLNRNWVEVVNDEKKLKALEIIKEKRVDVDCLMDCFQYDGFIHTNGLIEYNHSTTKTQKELDQEEYDLLKEVLL